MGQVHVGGGDGGDASVEHPQRQCIAWKSGEKEDCVDGREEEEGGCSGAEGERRGGGSVIWWRSLESGQLHLICKNTKVMVKGDKHICYDLQLNYICRVCKIVSNLFKGLINLGSSY